MAWRRRAWRCAHADTYRLPIGDENAGEAAGGSSEAALDSGGERGVDMPVRGVATRGLPGRSDGGLTLLTSPKSSASTSSKTTPTEESDCALALLPEGPRRRQLQARSVLTDGIGSLLMLVIWAGNVTQISDGAETTDTSSRTDGTSLIPPRSRSHTVGTTEAWLSQYVGARGCGLVSMMGAWTISG